MVDYNLVPYCNRETRRKVEKYRRKHSNLTFTEAYNKLYGTRYSEPTHFADTSLPQDFQQQTDALVKRINEELKGGDKMKSKIIDINKYALTLHNIPKLKVNRDLVNKENGFWRNDVINAWCLSDCIGPYYDETEYWLGIYDKPRKNGEDKIKVQFNTYGGMCGYEFKKFFDPAEIENDDDYKIQYMFIEKMNELIEKGVFTL